MLKESASKKEIKSATVLNESKRISKANDVLTRQMKEKVETIEKLDRTVNSLEIELSKSRDELRKYSKELKLY